MADPVTWAAIIGAGATAYGAKTNADAMGASSDAQAALAKKQRLNSLLNQYSQQASQKNIMMQGPLMQKYLGQKQDFLTPILQQNYIPSLGGFKGGAS